MRKKRFLAAILLSLSFCFVVIGAGYGEISGKYDFQDWKGSLEKKGG